MADISIWPGSSSFTAGKTPFGFYDSDSAFQLDADRVANYCARSLGFPIVDIELQDVNFYACFEEAVTVYGNEVYQYKIRENYLSMENAETGSSFNNKVITPSLYNTIKIAENYGQEALVGGNVKLYTGSIDLVPGHQEYDLAQWALDNNISGGIEIRRVFYQEPPAILRFFDPYAGTGTGIQSLLDGFGFGNMSPGISFMLMPISFDVAKIQAIEFNDQIRKAAYSFELQNNILRVFPSPRRSGSLLFQFHKESEKRNPIGGGNNTGLVTNIAEVPYENPVYSHINSIGKNWIYRYTAALARETLGYVRGKYGTLPLAGNEGATTTLNQSDLLTDARNIKESLIVELRDTLDQTSRRAQLERRAEETRFLSDTLDGVPLQIFIG